MDSSTHGYGLAHLLAIVQLRFTNQVIIKVSNYRIGVRRDIAITRPKARRSILRVSSWKGCTKAQYPFSSAEEQANSSGW